MEYFENNSTEGSMDRAHAGLSWQAVIDPIEVNKEGITLVAFVKIYVKVFFFLQVY